MKDLLIVDAHCDTLLDLADGKRSFAGGCSGGHLDLPRLMQGGVTLQFFAAFIGTEYKPERSLKRAMVVINTFHRLLEIYPELISVQSKKDLLELKPGVNIGALLSIEGGEALAGSLELLELYHRLGLRALTLTWNQRNEIADGVGEGPEAGGLSTFGREVVRKMNQMGILVDVSHLSDRGFWDVIDLSAHPVIASHSNCRSLCPHRRNLTDDQIKALAGAGGIVGVTFAGDFIDADQPTLSRLIDHIEHVINLVGIEHVGIGSDFDGVDVLPPELPDAAAYPNLVEALLARGLSESQVRAIMGGNLLRVLGEVLPE